MVNQYKDFILNIFFIFLPLVFYPYTFKIKGNDLLKNFCLFILFSISMVSTMAFPLDLHGLTYDFRSVVLTIGFLYGGTRVAMLLYLTLVTYRYVLGNPNNLLYSISIFPTYFIIKLILHKYNSLKLQCKILFAIAICTFIKLVAIPLYLTMTHNIKLYFRNPIETLETYLLQGLIVGLYVCLLESMIAYFRMQEEVINSEKIKIVSDIAASVAHEIRNPLTAVRGFIQLLGSDNLTPDRRDFYQKISLEELDRAQLIISDYLSLAKPDPENIEKIEINNEVSYVANVLHTYANYNNVQIVKNTLEDIHLDIFGDRHKLRQAMINIGKNAIEAMPDGGVLEFKVNKVIDTVVLKISDTGIGMSPQQIDRLGTPYYSTKEKGTGLGTMVSFGIIKKMNGKIKITSELGKGTEYKIVFPIIYP